MLTNVKWDKVGHMGMSPELSMLVGDVTPKQVTTGVYSDAGFNTRRLSSQIDERDYDSCFYGVADNYAQIIEKFPEITAEGTKYVITYQRLNKDEQSPDGGWRWTKWGEYIGDQDPQHDYLYWEPEIESIIVFNVFKVV